MGYMVKQLVLSGLEASGGYNYGVVAVDAAADFASMPALQDGSVGYITGDPDSLYHKVSGSWVKVDKSNLADDRLMIDGVSPYALMLMNVLFPRRAELGAIDKLTTRGDILYRAASAYARLAKGSAGDVLMQGANDPAWLPPGSLGFTDAGGYYAVDVLNDALQQLGALLAIDKKPEYIRSAAPTAQNDQYVGMLLYNTTDHTLKVCTTPGEAEWDTFTVSGPATSAGDVSITLNGVAFPVTVAENDTADQVAAKIRAAAFEGWTVQAGSGAIVDIKKDAVGVCSAPSLSGGTTGVTFATITRTNEGVASVWAALINV